MLLLGLPLAIDDLHLVFSVAKLEYVYYGNGMTYFAISLR